VGILAIPFSVILHFMHVYGEKSFNGVEYNSMGPSVR
jgi:hypothetical protein